MSNASRTILFHHRPKPTFTLVAYGLHRLQPVQTDSNLGLRRNPGGWSGSVER